MINLKLRFVFVILFKRSFLFNDDAKMMSFNTVSKSQILIKFS